MCSQCPWWSLCSVACQQFLRLPFFIVTSKSHIEVGKSRYDKKLMLLNVETVANIFKQRSPLVEDKKKKRREELDNPNPP